MGNMSHRAERLQIAAKAECDPRSVKRYLDGLPIRELTKLRIVRAMAELGIAPPSPRRHGRSVARTTQTPSA